MLEKLALVILLLKGVDCEVEDTSSSKHSVGFTAGISVTGG